MLGIEDQMEAVASEKKEADSKISAVRHAQSVGDLPSADREAEEERRRQQERDLKAGLHPLKVPFPP